MAQKGSKNLRMVEGVEIERAARRQGWRVKVHNATHRTLYPPHGAKPVVISLHRSSSRVMLTSVTEARKAGLIV